ncbi:MAG: hypothetical protein ACRD3D_01725 [Terriglobia bacterium]
MTGGAETRSTAPESKPRPRIKTGLVALVLVALVAQAAVRKLAGAAGTATAAQHPSTQPSYISSGAWLPQLSLGYEGVLADIYWTRVVQYYGRSRLAGHSDFEMLGSLLQATTVLDPHLVVAYRFGAIFLAEKPPGGAGRPEEAMQLLRRGMVANPEYWRFWEDLGFIEYWDLRDFRAAAKDFSAGAARPGAPIWMKTLAASVATQGGELRTSQALWSEVYRSAGNQAIRQSALEHLAALQAAEDIRSLDAALNVYKDREGRAAHSFDDLIAAGILSGVPRDPTGIPYALNSSGTAELAPSSRIDLRLAQ